jgi:hypothetical protein
MEKQIVLYNLAKHMTGEKYKEYVLNDKGPLMESLSTVKKYELVKITQSDAGKIPYQYVGIVNVSSLSQFAQNDAPTQKFQDFLKKWQPAVTDVLMLSGIQVY